FSILDYETFDFVDFAGIESVVRGQLHRIKPELCFIAGGPNMNMRSFIAFVAEKEKSVTTDAQDGWHVRRTPSIYYRPSFGYRTTRIDLITTAGSGVCARSPPAFVVGHFEIFSATSSPSVTSPNTQ